MRWKASLFLNDDSNNLRDSKFGLTSRKCAPKVTDMKGFEEDLILMVTNVKFTNVVDPFVYNVAEDLEKVNSSKNVLIFADKPEIFTK
jgi:hypothetical protein